MLLSTPKGSCWGSPQTHAALRCPGLGEERGPGPGLPIPKGPTAPSTAASPADPGRDPRDPATPVSEGSSQHRTGPRAPARGGGRQAQKDAQRRGPLRARAPEPRRRPNRCLQRVPLPRLPPRLCQLHVTLCIRAACVFEKHLP
ncbi:circumsporozoite protein-like [Pteropus medius]|uniref:circumsporozoite protein-like n=1 Tax=Pteropus vampyrus TaxID=132908 RepID=UPI00196AEAEA|nr:circumsporozoite protein-like [Pteropus giganteus]